VIAALDTRRYSIGPVMNGYSVGEAATVLGIPEQRVWELIARGVLAGTPEGDTGMRVFLRAQKTAEERDTPAHPTNGDGGGRDAVEASPFRELLTEFRNLTERYGQALLALGEARGEVASLRTRVELLEARMDLRLPSARPSSTVAWEIPDYPVAPTPPSEAEAPIEPAVDLTETAVVAPAVEAAAAEPVIEPMLAVEPEPILEPDAAVTELEPAEPEVTLEEALAPKARPRRSRRPRRSKTFADALARAQDPALEGLPGGVEAEEALAALQQSIAEAEAQPTLEPAAEPQAEEIADLAPVAATPAEQLVVEEEPPPVSLSPDVAEEVTAELAELEPMVPEPMQPPPVEAAAEPALEPMQPPPVEAAAEPMEPMEPPATEVTGEPAVEPVEAPLEAVVEPAQAIPPAYSTEVVEPDWFADGDFSWLQTGEAETEAAASATEPETIAESEAIAEPEAVAEPEAAAEPEEVAEHDAVLEGETGAEPAAGPYVEELVVREAVDEVETGGEPGSAMEDGSLEFEQSAAEVDEDAAAATAQAEAVEAQPNQAAIAAEPSAHEATFEPLTVDVWGRPRTEQPPAAADAGPVPGGEEALMWLGDEFEAAGLEIATQGWHNQPDLQASAPRVQEPQPLELGDAELAQLAQDEGWEPDEVEAIRTFLGRPAAGTVESEQAATDVQPAEPNAQEAADSPPPVEAAAEPQPPTEPRPATDPQPPLPTLRTRSTPADQARADWLRGRRGPAATAYRRLRRLFPS
jgi:hypothetical protein